MDYEIRFGGIERLFGEGSLKKLRSSHVAVIGIGGVGSWAVESLARSGIGKLTLVDMDDICETNINRQIHSLQNTVGKSKVTTMRNRILEINPDCEVFTIEDFFTADTAEAILSHHYDYIFDAIDSLPHKLVLAAACSEKKIPLIVSGGAGGKSDPTKIEIEDLGKSQHDNLLFRMRKLLKRDHGFPKGETVMGIACVFSKERAKFLQDDGSVCFSKEDAKNLRLDCASGLGTASFLTAPLGQAAASFIVKQLVK